MKNKQLEWREQEELLQQVVRVEGSCGDYSILRLSNGRYFVFDQTNLKFLVPSFGPLYTLPDDWKQWLKRGFIVITFPNIVATFSETPYDSEYYILHAKSKKFIAEGRGVEVEAYAFLEGRSDYFIAGNRSVGYAFFDKDGNQISGWYDKVSRLISSSSSYDIVEKDGKEAIFDKDNHQISDWFDQINDLDGLVVNQSPYYIAERNQKFAIFHKDGKQITDWFDWILPHGLPDGQSDYYVASENGKQSIFHKDGRQISDWFDGISDHYGLLAGKSSYYIAKRNWKYAIFHKNGKQITDWFDWVCSFGLVDGQSDYYIVRKDDVHYIFYYISKLGSSKMLGPFKEILDWGFVRYPWENVIGVEPLVGWRVMLTKKEVDNFLEEKEVENGR
jgi:antitoxin component YwqK of YwqJK toxin-antitoxin module